MITPEKGPTQWSSLLFTDGGGTTRSPGAVTLSGDGLKPGWDIQNATGSAGATTKRTGEQIREFDADFQLATEEDFDAWDDFQEYLEEMVANAKKPFARDVYHPDLARVHISSVTLGPVGLMVLDGKGGGRIKVHFLEYRPPTPAKAAGATKTEGNTVIDKDIAEIKKLQKEWETL